MPQACLSSKIFHIFGLIKHVEQTLEELFAVKTVFSWDSENFNKSLDLWKENKFINHFIKLQKTNWKCQMDDKFAEKLWNELSWQRIDCDELHKCSKGWSQLKISKENIELKTNKSSKTCKCHFPLANVASMIRTRFNLLPHGYRLSAKTCQLMWKLDLVKKLIFQMNSDVTAIVVDVARIFVISFKWRCDFTAIWMQKTFCESEMAFTVFPFNYHKLRRKRPVTDFINKYFWDLRHEFAGV